MPRSLPQVFDEAISTDIHSRNKPRFISSLFLKECPAGPPVKPGRYSGQFLGRRRDAGTSGRHGFFCRDRRLSSSDRPREEQAPGHPRLLSRGVAGRDLSHYANWTYVTNFDYSGFSGF
jgi:hypothetical protein